MESEAPDVKCLDRREARQTRRESGSAGGAKIVRTAGERARERGRKKGTGILCLSLYNHYVLIIGILSCMHIAAWAEKGMETFLPPFEVSKRKEGGKERKERRGGREGRRKRRASEWRRADEGQEGE
jgi:hypothetical protein